ncbi:MAG TPA: hypothetical protein VEW48_27060 [Thermoanaerobaculia bacterium]|nr:hypothetical protein [Thermoanaerobaculia bacterium]
MELPNVRRALAAPAIAALLGLAGAYPAAADDSGLIERSLRWLSGLWAVDDPAALAGPESGGPAPVWMMETIDKGAGYDPNGGSVIVPPPTGENQ